MRIYIVLIFSLMLSLVSQAQIIIKHNEGKKLKSEVGNSSDVMHFTLSNGLEVFLNQDMSQSKVWGAVVVKGGSSRDPKEATGTAHYFEHIMFKGTEKLGTYDYEKEEPYLDSIEQMYDLLGLNPDDEVFRASIMKKISHYSQKAATYAIPNEFDRIVEEMGGTHVNAYTSFENIVYYNAFPAASIDRWLELYAHRFEHPVFRLFQSELETVYEEKNMSLGNPFNRLFEEVYSKFYPNSVYGQQTILGSVEHLKTPSISAMTKYFKNYYVANNMALVLTGNFDAHRVKSIIQKRYSKWNQQNLPAKRDNIEKDFKGRTSYSKRITPIPIGVVGFRTVEKTHPDAIGLNIINELLSNGESTGMLDKRVKNNELLMVETLQDPHEDIGGAFILYLPKPVKQSLKSGEKIVIETLEELKNGDFSDQLLMAVKKDMIKSNQQMLESSEGKMKGMIDAFMEGKKWEDYLAKSQAINKLSKQDIIQIANKYYTENYLVFYSKMGISKPKTIQKPTISPLILDDKDRKDSEFAKSLERIHYTSDLVKYMSLDECDYLDIKSNLRFYQTPNKVNSIFSVNLKIGRGTYADPLLNQVVEYMNNVAPEGVEYEDFKLELQSLGASYYFFTNKSYLYIHIEGFDESYDKTISLVQQLIKKPSQDALSMKNIKQMRRLENQMPKRDLNTKARVLHEYAMYGENSSYLKQLSYKEVKELSAQDLIDKLHFALKYETSIHYVGGARISEAAKLWETFYRTSPKLTKSNSPVYRPMRKVNQNTIFIQNDKKALQSHIYFGIASDPFNRDNRVRMNAFNKYFGGGMNAIVFQEIREFRSLAYSAWGSFSVPFQDVHSSSYHGGLVTQADKTLEAVYEYTKLLDNMPVKKHRMSTVRGSLLKSISSSTPSFRTQSLLIENWQKKGFTEDPRKKQYNAYKEMEFEEIVSFYNAYLMPKKRIIAITGNSKQFSENHLMQFGEIKKVKLKEMYRK